MTMVRMKVAKSELTFSTPILPKIAASAAKPADSRAQSCHWPSRDFMTPSPLWARLTRAGGPLGGGGDAFDLVAPHIAAAPDSLDASGSASLPERVAQTRSIRGVV